MTTFLDLRHQRVGGGLASDVAIVSATSIADYATMNVATLLSNVNGRHLLIATHGFNVDRASGIRALSNWEQLLELPSPSAFVGVLWPGDSTWMHGLDYPEEPRIANDAGALLAAFVDQTFGGAASISFASHSLGARLVLQTVGRMQLPVRRAILMAGAIDNDCLVKEFKGATSRAGVVSVLASKKDAVLSSIFPLGNFLGGLLTVGHPWAHAALGHAGPASPAPANVRTPFQIPDAWRFGHGDYLAVTNPRHAPIDPGAADFPASSDAEPVGQGWEPAWSAAVASSRFR